MNTSPVTITSDALGNVIGVSKNNPEYGYLRIEQTVTQISEGGWVRPVKRSTLLKGKVEDLKAVNYKNGDILPGNIIVKESFSPFSEVDPDRHLKIAGNTGVVCTQDDQPIYRDTFFTTNPDAVDEFIAHDNSAQIKEANNAQKAIDTLVNPEGLVVL